MVDRQVRQTSSRREAQVQGQEPLHCARHVRGERQAGRRKEHTHGEQTLRHEGVNMGGKKLLVVLRERVVQGRKTLCCVRVARIGCYDRDEQVGPVGIAARQAAASFKSPSVVAPPMPQFGPTNGAM